MFKSKSFGRIFWVDDDFEFRSCPQNVDGTGDFDCEDYVSEWSDCDRDEHEFDRVHDDNYLAIVDFNSLYEED